MINGRFSASVSQEGPFLQEDHGTSTINGGFCRWEAREHRGEWMAYVAVCISPNVCGWKWHCSNRACFPSPFLKLYSQIGMSPKKPINSQIGHTRTQTHTRVDNHNPQETTRWCWMFIMMQQDCIIVPCWNACGRQHLSWASARSSLPPGCCLPSHVWRDKSWTGTLLVKGSLSKSGLPMTGASVWGFTLVDISACRGKVEAIRQEFRPVAFLLHIGADRRRAIDRSPCAIDSNR